MRIALAILCLALAVVPCAAEGHLVRAEASATALTVGDRAVVTITITAPGARVIKLGEMPEEAGDYAILDPVTSEEIDLSGARRLVLRFVLVPFIVGDITAPSLDYEIIGADGQSTGGATPPLPLLVRSVSPDPEGPRAAQILKDVISPPEEDNSLIIAGAGFALVLAALALWWISHNRRPGSVEALLRLSPADRAIRDLDRIDVKGRLGKGEFKGLATDVSEILRRFLGLRYHIFALEMTSTELLGRFIALNKDDHTNGERLGAVFSFCDLVKFARHQPDAAAAEQTIVTSRAVISATREETFTAIADAVGSRTGGK